MAQPLVYGAVVALAVFFVGMTTGLGGSLVPNLAFSALMGVFAAALFAAVRKFAKRSQD